MSACTHVRMIRRARPTEAEKHGAVCEDCVRIGSGWVHLRQYMTCGRIGCCDSSPGRHARAHAVAAAHPVVTSAEPGERWCYCFVDDAFI